MRIRPLREFSDGCGVYGLAHVHVVRNSGYRCDPEHAPRISNVLCFLHRGPMRFSGAEGTLFEAGEQDVVYIPAGCRCMSEYLLDNTEVTVITFRLRDDGGEFAFSDRVMRIPAPFGRGLEPLFRDFCAVGFGAEGTLTRLSRFYAILDAVNKTEYGPEEPGYALLRPGLRLLSESFTENIPMARVAAASMVSEAYFRRLFRRFFDKTPIEYRNELRLRYVDALVKSGQFSVSEAVREAGIESISYYYRMKRRKTD